MSEKVNFRGSVTEEVFNSNKKSFLSILPVGSQMNFIFFFFFSVFLITVFIFVEVPIKVNVTGVIKDENKDYHMHFDKEGYIIKKILYKKGELLKKGDIIFSLEKSYNQSSQNKININIKHINEVDNYLEHLRKSYKNKVNVLKEIHKKQIKITEILKKEVIVKVKLKEQALKNRSRKLITLDDLNNAIFNVENKKRELAESEQAETILLKELMDVNEENKKSFTSAVTEKMEISERIVNEEKEQELINISSPCDCTIERINIVKGESVRNGQLIVTFKNHFDEKFSTVLYASTSNFGDINSERSVINIKVDSYPFLKYGTIKGDINYISRSPISDLDIKSNIKSGDYYIIEANIKNVPKNIRLRDGMTVKAHIITKTMPLYKFLLKDR